jgi:hypothetical protein
VTGPKQLKTRSDVMLARGTCQVILVVGRSSFACTAQEEVDEMVSGENSPPKARPEICLTYPDVRGTSHVIIAVVRSFFLASDAGSSDTGSDGERQKPQSHMAE